MHILLALSDWGRSWEDVGFIFEPSVDKAIADQVGYVILCASIIAVLALIFRHFRSPIADDEAN
jgi:hypothetical protein